MTEAEFTREVTVFLCARWVACDRSQQHILDRQPGCSRATGTSAKALRPDPDPASRFHGDRIVDDLVASAGFWINRDLYDRVLMAAGE